MTPPFPHLPKRLTELQIAMRADRCIGCGKFGFFFCRHCREFDAAVQERIRKLAATARVKFAAKPGDY